MSENTQIGQTEVKLGLILEHSGTQCLLRIIGKRVWQKNDIYRCGPIGDSEALKIGLVKEVVQEENLMKGCQVKDFIIIHSEYY